MNDTITTTKAPHHIRSPHLCQRCKQTKKPGTIMHSQLMVDEDDGYMYHIYQCTDDCPDMSGRTWLQRSGDIKLADLGSWARKR